MKKAASVTLGICALLAMATSANALDLSINAIQTNMTPGTDATIYDGEVHNVTGGIVTHIAPGYRPRVWIQDPAHPTWGAIVVKDWHDGELANAVNIGDWVSFDNITVEEYRGTTFLQYNRNWSTGLSFAVDTDPGVSVPTPTVVTAADLTNPVNHAASEPYESMIVTLEDITVSALDLGKNDDNYELLQGGNTAWGSDYLNLDAGGPYHPDIFTGAHLESITGIVEQYTRTEPAWDYYQLLTRSSADIVPVPEPATLAALMLGMALIRRR